jgi:hypothetical protein
VGEKGRWKGAAYLSAADGFAMSLTRDMTGSKYLRPQAASKLAITAAA